MEIMLVPVPVFDRNVAVQAYLFEYQHGNDLLHAARSTSVYDGAMYSPLLSTLNIVGLEALTMGKPVFVPINKLMLLTNPEKQCAQPADKIIFLLDDSVAPEEPYLSRIQELRQKGYRFAFQKIENASALEARAEMFSLGDYIFLNHRAYNPAELAAVTKVIAERWPNLQIVVSHIDEMEAFESIEKDKRYLYEGRFFRTPVSKGESKPISPLQTNLIRLLNLVRDDSFEFDEVTAVVQRDTALTISLLKLVNSPFIGVRRKINTIGQAVTMLGQQEVRKWVTTAVAKLLGADKPDEVTRLSLVRARYAENLAKRFGMADQAQSLFLMGLFSVLDVVLGVPMSEALQMVQVSDPIRDALLSGKGPYYPVYDFIRCYEKADWQSVCRMLILYDVSIEDVYEAYVNSLLWYNDLLSDREDGK